MAEPDQPDLITRRSYQTVGGQRKAGRSLRHRVNASQRVCMRGRFLDLDHPRMNFVLKTLERSGWDVVPGEIP